MTQQIDNCIKDCQSLLSNQPKCHGWLRMPGTAHRKGEVIGNSLKELQNFFSSLTDLIPWDNRFVVICDNFLHIFKKATSKKPLRVLRLVEFSRIETCSNINKDVPWPFQLVKTKGNENFLFATDSEDDRNKWMRVIDDLINKEEISSDDDQSDSEYENPDRIFNKFEDETKQKIDHSKRTRDPLPPLPPRETTPSSPPIVAPKNFLPTPPKPPKKPNLSNTPDVVPNSQFKKQLPSSGIDYTCTEIYDDSSLFNLAYWEGSRDDAFKFLSINKQIDGLYLIRKSSRNQEEYTISILVKEKIIKYTISIENNNYKIFGNNFDSVEELLDYYTKNNIPNKDFKLKTPYKNNQIKKN